MGTYQIIVSFEANSDEDAVAVHEYVDMDLDRAGLPLRGVVVNPPCRLDWVKVSVDE